MEVERERGCRSTKREREREKDCGDSGHHCVKELYSSLLYLNGIDSHLSEKKKLLPRGEDGLSTDP